MCRTTGRETQVLLLPSLLKQDLYAGRNGVHVWFNEVRCEFLLAFSDLVKHWDTLAINPEAIPTLDPERNRKVSRFCALLHFCFLAWDAGLDTRAGYSQRTEFELSTSGGLARPERAHRTATTDNVFRRTKEFAEELLREQADPLAELCLKWIHQYWNGFGPLERAELHRRYFHAFQRMHNFVRFPPLFPVALCSALQRRRR